MFKLKLLAIALIAFCSFVPAEKMVKIKLPYNEAGLYVMLHESFKPLEEGYIAQKYPAAKKADAVFSTEDNWVDFAFNIARTQWEDNDLEMFVKFNKATLSTLYDKITYEKESIEEINGRKFAIYEFVAMQKADYKTQELGVTSGPVKHYYHLVYTIHNKKVLLFNFNCPFKHKKKWQPESAKIMASIKFAKK
jgi:hypothetical protein